MTAGSLELLSAAIMNSIITRDEVTKYYSLGVGLPTPPLP